MHFPTDNLPSFLEVSEEPDPQNLSPAALQCAANSRNENKATRLVPSTIRETRELLVY